ncbi:MAG: GNAT family N-acetyltransferase [Christensenellales bacterium]
MYYINIEDIDCAKRFLDEQRNALDRIEFFYPYMDDELQQVVENGRFVGVFDKNQLVATIALDKDNQYAKQIADVVSQCTAGRISPPYIYEMSGVMVDKRYRGRGLAKQMVEFIRHVANQENIGWICAVVQLENVASMRTMLSQGFCLAGVYAMGGEYDFGYFVRRIEKPIETLSSPIVCVPFRDMDKHRDMLSQGYVGTQIRSSGIGYTPMLSK